ncbi:histidine kinase [Salinibacterium xinjiangense]|uniref:GAF domain-containing protein n=1 Tax=Salinibacterium xinjiangense TaxID=386302 RepID=A0A2C8YDB2_9MICO|nr:GAF domain-containing protein [Salinibacterium xinjiangense]GGK96525.1 histidine kinase [Salinibacterium xinjiangense]SOE48285.1 GAF domain-containing protein [Salinibacterium xinjiangense]
MTLLIARPGCDVDRLQDLATQGRLRALLRANEAIIGHLDLPVVLERIVGVAVNLVGAQYGALGVLSPDGGLEQFINVGMTPQQVKHIGNLPQGHGLLGALIDDPHPIRLPRLAEDPRSVGFPAHHPPMASFLGVPIRVRDEVYGNLYLSNQSSGEFSEDDEQLVVALAATAGIAIENARLFAETLRRQAWAAASAEITAALVSTDEGNSLNILTARMLTLADADVVWVLQPTNDPGQMIVTTARGIDEERIEGITMDAGGSIIGSVIEAGQPRQVDDGAGLRSLPGNRQQLGAVMAVPLAAPGRGVLLVARLAGRPRFARGDLEMAANFAGQASVAMEISAARAARQKVALLEDRGRIARDLHDHVIQQLFATGLELQNIAGQTQGDIAERISASVTNLDGSISQIRTVIFALSTSTREGTPAVRHAVIDLANEFAASLSKTPTVSFSGPVDLMITNDLADDVLAVTREALANVVKHAQAQHASIDLTVQYGWATLAITDDGHGIEGSTRRSGVVNLENRALDRGGSFTIDSDHHGTRLRWSVPIEVTR